MKYRVCVGDRTFGEYEGKKKCEEVQASLVDVYVGKEISIRYKNGNLVPKTQILGRK